MQPTSATTPRESDRRRAYTLLETLVVLGLIAVLSSVVVVSMGHGVPGRRLRATASDLAAMIRWARSESVARGETIAIRHDLARGEHWLAAPDPDGEAGAASNLARTARISLPGGIRVHRLILSGGVAADDSVVTVMFSPFGGCEGYRLCLAGADGEYCTVDVLPLGAEVLVRPRCLCAPGVGGGE